jgi:uncharacterized protein
MEDALIRVCQGHFVSISALANIVERDAQSIRQQYLKRLVDTGKRRLRKKLHVGEFQEFGFTLTFTIDLQQKNFNDALDGWIDYVESQGWCFGGGGSVSGSEIAGYLCQYDGGTLTESDREQAAKWLAAQSWVLSHQLDPLSDAWYGPWQQ